MSAPIVDRFRNNVAPRLLSKFNNGGVAVFTTITTPNPDPSMPPTQDNTPREVRAYAKGVSAQLSAADSSLEVTDLQLIFAAIDYTPSTEDYIEVNGNVMAVLRWDSIPANGPPAIYKVYVR